MIDVADLYDNYILDLRDKHFGKRYEGKESWYHASGAGLCMRKHYFQSVEKLEPTEKDSGTMRIFRIGDLVHEDIQYACQEYARKNGTAIYVEKEIEIPRLNVRSWIDLMMIDDNRLYDIKTCNDWSWKGMFGKYGSGKPKENYCYQMGTYGLYFKEIGQDVDSMALLFYNKNNSRMKEVEVPLEYIDSAEQYWNMLAEYIEEGVPPVDFGTSPVEEWECNAKYCSFFEPCGGGISGREKNKKGTEL